MPEPHGSKLINLYLDDQEKQNALNKIDRFPKITLTERNISDLELLGNGAYSPLTGFMKKEDYKSVIEEMHLQDGLPWSLPITLAVEDHSLKKISDHSEIILLDQKKRPLGILQLEDIFEYDKNYEVNKVYKTSDIKHPGVRQIYQQGNYYLGGSIRMIHSPEHHTFKKYRLNPGETRKSFAKKGWKTIVGFQTRNPIHRAHEYLQKCALEMVDGLLIHPLIGPTKADDIPVQVRMKSYEILLDTYYPKSRVIMSVFPAAMRYAGPREAIFHAIVRKNYGCTHMIIGRDHAGVGKYYGSYDAQKIFDEFSASELEITPIFFENAFYCKKCMNMATAKTCPHTKEFQLNFSGTEIRQKLLKKIPLPPEVTRTEVAEVLAEAFK